MSLDTLIHRIFEFVRDLWKARILPWITARRFTIFFCIVIGIVGYLFYTEFVRQNTVTLEFYVGGSGGKNSDSAHKIQRHLAGSEQWLSRSVQLDVHYTEGYKENYQLVREDIDGRRIAFAYDGMNTLEGLVDSDDVQVLVPLQKSYVHVIARKAFLEECGTLATRNSFKDVAQAIGAWMDSRGAADASNVAAAKEVKRLPRFYLGDHQSATRDLSRFILSKCDLEPMLLEVAGVRNFEEMQSLLARGELDVAFYVGPRNSRVVREIAGWGNCCLIGLGDLHASMRQDDLPFLSPGKFYGNSYVADGDFCPTDLDTLCTQKVVICSRKMSTEDAYLLGSLIRNTMKRDVDQDWNGSDSGFEPHIAYSLIWAGQVPRSLPEWLVPLIPVLAIILLNEVVVIARRGIGLETPPEVAEDGTPEPEVAANTESPGSQGAEYERLSHLLEALVHDWGDPHAGLTREEGRKRLRAIRQLILGAVRKGEVEISKATHLMQAYDELWDRITRSRRKSRSTSSQ